MSDEQKKASETEFDRYVDGLDLQLIKKNFIKAYKKLFGNIAGSCRAAGIVRQTFYNWQEKDALFAGEIAKIQPEEDFLDLLEAEMQKKVVIDKDTTMMIFMAKTKGKKRGYIERTEQIIGGTNVEIKIEPDKEGE